MAETISPMDLQARMDSREGVVLLDVRAPEACASWHIQGQGVTLYNIPNSKLKAQGIHAFSELPKDQEIVAVCAKGISARETAAWLTEHDYRAVILQGGMEAWGAFLHPVVVAETEPFTLYQIQRPGKGCLSYMIIADDEAAVVDAARDVSVYRDLAERNGAQIRFVLDTHLHADHVSGGPQLAAVCDADYFIAAAEMIGAVGSYQALEDGFRIPFKSMDVQMMARCTPGHTLGSTSFLLNNTYFLCGDTVFVSGLGRPDLKGQAREMAARLYDTVTDTLSALPDELWVLPSHYSNYAEQSEFGFVGAHLGTIRAGNPLLAMDNRNQFVETLVSRVGETPPNYEAITQVNRGQLDLPVDELGRLEIGPNRCAVQP